MLFPLLSVYSDNLQHPVGHAAHFMFIKPGKDGAVVIEAMVVVQFDVQFGGTIEDYENASLGIQFSEEFQLLQGYVDC